MPRAVCQKTSAKISYYSWVYDMPGYYCHHKVMGNAGENSKLWHISYEPSKPVKNTSSSRGEAFPPNIQY